VTAAKDIWKEAESRLSGAISKTASAAQATRRSEIALRSSTTASSTRQTIRKARWVGTGAPTSKR
jgi:hypothetical protein